MITRAFASTANTTVNINVSASSQSVRLVNRQAPVAVRVVNNGLATVWIGWGGPSASVTTSTGLPIGPGVHEVLTMEPDLNGELYIAAIAAGATGIIYFTSGEGV